MSCVSMQRSTTLIEIKRRVMLSALMIANEHMGIIYTGRYGH